MHAQSAYASILIIQDGFEECLLFPGIESRERYYAFCLLRETMTNCNNDNLVQWEEKWEQESLQIWPSTVSDLFWNPERGHWIRQRRGGTEQSQDNVCGEGAVSPGRAVGFVGRWSSRSKLAEEQGA